MVMRNASDKFIKETSEAVIAFPELKLSCRDGCLPYLEGSVNLFDKNGLVYDTYNIRIECSKDYPGTFPWVYEVAGRLPANIEWHVYSDGHFCICTPVEEHIYCRKGITLVQFITAHVIPYLHNQSFREREGYFLNERSHGDLGVVEYFYQKLGTKSLPEIIKILKFIDRCAEPSRTSTCFCGKRKKYRHCHRTGYRDLKLLGNSYGYFMQHINNILRMKTL